MCCVAFSDQVLESYDYSEAEAEATEKDLPTAGQNSSPRADEHQRRYLGKAVEEKPQLPKVPKYGQLQFDVWTGLLCRQIIGWHDKW